MFSPCCLLNISFETCSKNIRNTKTYSENHAEVFSEDIFIKNDLIAILCTAVAQVHIHFHLCRVNIIHEH